jgi:hypothetical protein
VKRYFSSLTTNLRQYIQHRDSELLPSVELLCEKVQVTPQFISLDIADMSALVASDAPLVCVCRRHRTASPCCSLSPTPGFLRRGKNRTVCMQMLKKKEMLSQSVWLQISRWLYQKSVHVVGFCKTHVPESEEHSKENPQFGASISCRCVGLCQHLCGCRSCNDACKCDSQCSLRKKTGEVTRAV